MLWRGKLRAFLNRILAVPHRVIIGTKRALNALTNVRCWG